MNGVGDWWLRKDPSSYSAGRCTGAVGHVFFGVLLGTRWAVVGVGGRAVMAFTAKTAGWVGVVCWECIERRSADRLISTTAEALD